MGGEWPVLGRSRAMRGRSALFATRRRCDEHSMILERAAIAASTFVLLAGCSAGTPSASDGGPKSGTSAGAPLSAEEKAACDGKDYASLKCLVAVRARRIAGDEKAAAELLDLGCKSGDLEACLDTGKTDRVAETCKTGASSPEHAVACERFQDKTVIEDERFRLYKLAVKEGLALRARYGPALIAEIETAKRVCAPLPFQETKSASLEGTALAKERGLVDATILCPETPLAAAAKLKEGQGSSSPPVPRTLKDGFYRSGTTLDASAPVGKGNLGVSCPSRLAGDRGAIDVWLKVPTDEGELLIVAAVPGEGACLVAEEEKQTFRDDRVFLEKLLRPRRAAVTKLLDEAAIACDAGMSAHGKIKLSIDAEALNAAAVQAKCEFGPAFLIAGSSGELDEDGRFVEGHMDMSGLVMRTKLYTDGKKRAVMTFRKRDATLVIEAKEPPPLAK